MDLALAIWQINPASEYRLTDDQASLLEWRGPGPKPTQAQLDAAWAAYQAGPLQAQQQAEAARQAALVVLKTKSAAAGARLDALIVALGL